MEGLKFSIQREVFLKPLRKVAGVVERRQTHLMPILSHVLIHIEDNRLLLTTSDQEMEVVADCPLTLAHTSGKTTVSFRKLMDICRALPEGAVLNFSAEGERAVIKAANSRFTLSTLDAKDFPALETIHDQASIELSAPFFRKLLEQTAFAMADQDVRYYLNGMLVEFSEKKISTVASDGHRLALNTLPIETAGIFAPQRVILPRKGVIELQRILDEVQETVAVHIGANHIRISAGDIRLTSKLLESRYPDYKRIVPQTGDKVVIGNREKLKEAFYRAAVLLNDKSRGIRMQLTTHHMRVLATSLEQDEVEEQVEVNYAGPDFEMSFNVKYLIDFLNIITSEEIKFTFSDPNSSARLESTDNADGVYVIMPMRI